jgi:HEAT repeat protein
MNVLRMRVWHLLVLIAVCAAFLAVFQYRRGVYDPTSARLRQARYADAAGKVTAIRELMESEASGSAVVQTLLGALVDADPAVRAVAAQAMADVVGRTAAIKKQDDPHAGAIKAALTEALRDRDPTVRLRAASGLGQLKVKSEESFAILLHSARTTGQPVGRFRAAREPDDRAVSLWDLAYSYRDKPEARAAILEAMRDREPRVRMWGIVAINCYLRDSDANWYRRAPDYAIPEPIAEVLLARLDDEVDQVCRKAADVLGRTGWRIARRAVPLLIRNLAGPRSSTHVWTAHALRDFGLEAEEARPALRALADGAPEGAVRIAAREAVEVIDKASRTFHEQTLPDLIADLGDDDAEIRAAAAEALATHGTRAKAAVPDLIRALDDPQPKVRRAASAALGAAGEAGPERSRQANGQANGDIPK